MGGEGHQGRHRGPLGARAPVLCSAPCLQGPGAGEGPCGTGECGVARLPTAWGQIRKDNGDRAWKRPGHGRAGWPWCSWEWVGVA